tara:strand:- start:157271 stop:157897 length:627 start_codon:yes stop_codon:yes gene_type:complete
MEISNKLEMNKFIEENPGSVQFPLIADLYLKDKDFKKAEEICTNGLKHYSNHPDGLFILAQIRMKLKKTKSAENILKNVLKFHSIYPEGLNLLTKTQEVLNRSSNTINATRKKYKKFDFSSESHKEKTFTRKKISKTKKSSTVISSSEFRPLNVSSKLATFTLVDILENQGLYLQAIDILEILREKKSDNNRIEKYQKRISEKLHSNN